MTFSVDLARYIAKTNQRAADVQSSVALQLFEKIVTRTPVDTGRLRSNHNVTINRADDSTSDNRTVSDARAQAKSAASEFKPGTSLFIVNGLPYMRPIEYGSSTQAPQGVYRITAEEFQQAVRAALNGS